jgi:hypothetical protein
VGALLLVLFLALLLLVLLMLMFGFFLLCLEDLFLGVNNSVANRNVARPLPLLLEALVLLVLLVLLSWLPWLFVLPWLFALPLLLYFVSLYPPPLLRRLPLPTILLVLFP